MHSFSFAKDVGEFVSPLVLDSLRELTTATHSTQAGSYVDRLAGGLTQSGKVCFWVHAEIIGDEQITVSGQLQDATSSTGAGLADFGSSTQTLLLGSTDSSGAQTVRGVLAYDVDFTECNQFLRSQISLSFTAATTAASHQATVVASVIGAGFETLPSS
jgi:hypothetical protein